MLSEFQAAQCVRLTEQKHGLQSTGDLLGHASFNMQLRVPNGWLEDPAGPTNLKPTCTVLKCLQDAPITAPAAVAP